MNLTMEFSMPDGVDSLVMIDNSALPTLAWSCGKDE